MEITKKMYLLAKEIVKEYEMNFNINEIEILDPFQISILDQIEEKEKSSVKKEKDFSLEVLNCYRVCLDYFPENLHPKKPKSWYEVIDKLNRIDKVPFSEIERLCKLAREDSFWSKNFLSLTKLRMKNKEKIPYIVVFNEKFKEKPKTINRQTEQTIKNNIKGW